MGNNMGSSKKENDGQESEYPADINNMVVESTTFEICKLHEVVTAMEKRITALEARLEQSSDPPVDILSIREKVRIVNAARATGSRSEIIKAHRLINGM